MFPSLVRPLAFHEPERREAFWIFMNEIVDRQTPYWKLEFGAGRHLDPLARTLGNRLQVRGVKDLIECSRQPSR
jgi:hypothetical protein